MRVDRCWHACGPLRGRVLLLRVCTIARCAPHLLTKITMTRTAARCRATVPVSWWTFLLSHTPTTGVSALRCWPHRLGVRATSHDPDTILTRFSHDPHAILMRSSHNLL
eukprot:347701-Chlamydomonas_euryale.AAC.17